MDCDATDVRLWNEQRPLPLEVLSPAVETWIEQWYVLPLQIARDVWALVRITSLTAESQIRGNRCSAVFLRDDVIDLEGKKGDFSRELAILTATIRSLSN